VILLLNGAFGIGKTTVARVLVARVPNALLFDPEMIGLVLQRSLRFLGRPVDDFQDLPAWRRLTIAGLRIARLWSRNVIVPMAFSDTGILAEMRTGISRFEPQLVHVCLVAPVEEVHRRLRARGADPARHAWEYRRATECCAVHERGEFAHHVSAVDRTPDQLAQAILSVIQHEGDRPT
jgi:chloramphenicol 3-O-phosphotransferase